MQRSEVKSLHLRTDVADWSVDKIMAYLNCPFCPAQATHVETHTATCQPVMLKFKCNGGKHTFFVEKGDVDGDTRAEVDDGSTDRTGTCA